MHRVAGVRAQDIRVGDDVDGRVLAGVTRHSGENRSCDLLTEDLGYQINGVPVNSMIEEMHRAALTSKVNLRKAIPASAKTRSVSLKTSILQ